MRTILLMILAALVPSPVSSLPASSQTVAHNLESYCDSQHNPELPGGFAVSAIKDGEVIFKKAYGGANVEYSIPFSTTSVFDFASIAKSFTGWAVAKLITEGRISPDDDIRHHLPDLPDFGHTITISHLLHHTSGMRDWVGLLKLAGKDATDVHSRQVLRKVIFNQMELNFVPGEEFSYSNTGYFLLADLVESVTGQDFADWCAANIFEPLAMENTRILQSHAAIAQNRAMAYRQNEQESYDNCFPQLVSPGSSSLHSTLDDMTQWLLAVDERSFGGPAVWELMLAKGALNNGDAVDYGYGFMLETFRSHAVIRHGGQLYGYLSDMVYFPNERVGYILMISRNPPVVSITGCVDEILLAIADTTTASDNGNHGEQRDEELPVLLSHGVSPSLLDACAGEYYAKENNLRVVLRNEGGTMKMDFPWQSGLNVIALQDGAFYIEEYDCTITLISEDDAGVTALEFRREDESWRFHRLQLDASGWLDIEGLVGEYYCDELQATYKLTLKENALVARSLLNPDVVLARCDEDFFLGDSWWFSNIHLTRKENGAITGFLLEGDERRIRNLRFRKQHAAM